MRYFLTSGTLLFSILTTLFSQSVPDEEISRRIQSYKGDVRGPYKEIRWYCKDGTTLPPQERCPEPGGIQRARHKDEVYALSKSNHIFLGQILATTPFPDFWDTVNNHSRLKQYELEKYLRAIDNGWVLRRAQYYRGAFQAEDETAWGLDFYRWLLSDDQVIKENFFLLRQSLKDIPHQGDDNLTQEIRSVSRIISEKYAPFLDLRVKIHGQPEEADLEKVVQFRDRNKQKLDEELLKMFDELISDMRKLYMPVDLNALKIYLDKLPSGSEFRKNVVAGINDYSLRQSGQERIADLSSILYELRKDILSVSLPEERLAVMDLSIALEGLLIRELSGLSTESIKENLEMIQMMGMASAGCGYLELWEWEQLSSMFRIQGKNELSLEELQDFFETGRRMTDWGVGMFRAHYNEVIDLYEGFEPLVTGFLDDKVRSSLLLWSGINLDRLDEQLISYRPALNSVMDLPGQHAIRGLNPGYAVGELVVVPGQAGNLVLDRDKIYVFNKPPADLKPVAGIATVTEGNMVSHVQLLARNLGIPNAVLSPQNLEELKQFSGQVVFYAVSSGGTVVMKPFEKATPEEKKLIEVRQRNQEKIVVPVSKIKLNQTKVIPLTRVSSKSSGVLCGPKAANLGQLKMMFPDHVVDGIVIPFGIFRMHLDQSMPGEGMTYWEYLGNIFETAGKMRSEGASEKDVETYMLTQLENFRKAIRQIKFQDEFLDDLTSSFHEVFGNEIGKLPVFLRSDTNMEDLKEFTGAGLNLTLFNVVNYEAILQGIRDVWASPYTERSYKWRQQYLLNPENVYPSILIIPSVDVDYSGVMVTRGIINRGENDLTVAFSRGAGGAVDGQAAESYLIMINGNNILLSPAREPSYITLPTSGGSQKHFATFEDPVLNEWNINSLRIFAEKVKKELPHAPGIETSGPFDIELGFKDNKLWLFQVRPFVENKNAAASQYLNSLNPLYDGTIMIPISK
jgi:hypothetical protein